MSNKPKKQTPPRITLKKHEEIVSELKYEIEEAYKTIEEQDKQIVEANEDLGKRDAHIFQQNYQIETMNKQLSDFGIELIEERERLLNANKTIEDKKDMLKAYRIALFALLFISLVQLAIKLFL